MADDPYLDFVRRYEHALAASLPVPPPAAGPAPSPTPGGPVALIFSPHPDDEVITGALPLRLQAEAGARVVNVAVTLGSNPARQTARKLELEAACARLGWSLEVLDWTGVNPAAVTERPDQWGEWTARVAGLIRAYRPRWIFYPHAKDWHPTHVGVHLLVNAALMAATGGAAPPWRVLTEYWQPQDAPNLLVECPPPQLAALVAALCCHVGEIARNPYHLTLPAWMADNVRRGAERVAGPGRPAPKFPFGTLYRVEPALPADWESIMTARPFSPPKMG